MNKKLLLVCPILAAIAASGCAPPHAKEPSVEVRHEGVYSSTCPQGPQLTVDTSSVPVRTRNQYVPLTSSDFQTALTNAQPGDEIVLTAGTTYSGTFMLPPKPTGGWILIRSNQTTSTSFPGPGKRIEKGHASLLPKIVAPDGQSAITTSAGANHHFWIVGVEITTVASPTTMYDNLVDIGEGSATSNQASYVVLDRVYVHGNASAQIKHAVIMNGGYMALINSRVGDVHTNVPSSCPNAAEAQGFLAWNGTGPYKVDNNYISSSTQGFMFGGEDAAASNMIPGDITITHNHVYKPVTTAWRQSYLAKTGVELKAGNRVLIEGNYVENAWDNCPGENVGGLFRVTVRDQDGTAPFTNVSHVLISGNKWLNAGKGFAFLGSDTNSQSDRENCIAVVNNLFDKIPGDFGSDPTYDNGMGRLFTVEDGGVPGVTVGGVQNLTIEHNTWFTTTGPAVNTVWANYPNAEYLDTGVIFRNNLGLSTGGIQNADGSGYTEGDSTIGAYFDSATDFARNDLISVNSAHYASHCSTDPTAYNYCFFHASTTAVGFTDYANKNYRLLSTSPDHNQCTHQFSGTPHDIGIYDWSTTTGVGWADTARDVQPDSPPGCTTCGSDCFDFSRDPFHCGGCNNACTGSQTCVAGVCTGTCSGTVCNGVCVDTTTDPNNCGGCSNVCGAHQSCSASQCACTTGYSMCGTTCVDKQTDNSNCGTCGNICPGQQQCVSGVCAGTAGHLVGTDIDADLKGDFLARDSNGNFQVWKSDGNVEGYNTSFASYYTDVGGWNSGNRFFPMDFDGDGKTDLLTRGGNGGWDVNLSNGVILNGDHSFYTTHTDAAGWNDANRFLVVDVNGDRKFDLLGRQSDGTFQILLNSNGVLSQSTTFATYYTDVGGWTNGNQFFAIDLNGDGKTDFMTRAGNGGWDTFTSNGTTYVQGPSFTTSYTDAAGYSSGDYFFVLDINGDGKQDLVVRNPDGTFDVWKSDGTTPVYTSSFTSFFTDDSGFQTGNRFIVRDVDGDGKTDMMMRYANGGWDVYLSDGTQLVGTVSFTSSLSDANGWSSGLRFF